MDNNMDNNNMDNNNMDNNNMDNNNMDNNNMDNNNNMNNNPNNKIKKLKKKKKNKLVRGEKIPPKDKENIFLNINYVNTNTQLHTIFKSIYQNYIFYIVLICCLYSFSKFKYINNTNKHNNNLFLIIYSLIFITLYGYCVHFVSHYLNTQISELYKTYDNIFTRNKYFNYVITKLIDFAEFHAKVHHNTEINKTCNNIILEFINNFVMQGGILIILKIFLDLIDNRIIVLWSLFYASVHNINYNIFHPVVHQQHHINNSTNFGIDIWDIIIGSKYDWDTIETHNHAAINVIIITLIIYYISMKFNNKGINNLI